MFWTAGQEVAAMTITISSEDPPFIKGDRDCREWASSSNAIGPMARRATASPNQSVAGLDYLTDTRPCTCQHAQRHPVRACKHQLAIRRTWRWSRRSTVERG
jgi:hypothetical protein